MGVGCGCPDCPLVRMAGEAGAGFFPGCCRAQGEALKKGGKPQGSLAPQRCTEHSCALHPRNHISGLLLELYSCTSAFHLATHTMAPAPLVSSLGQQWHVLAITQNTKLPVGVCFLFNFTLPV